MLWEWPWLSRLQPQSSSPSEGWILLARMETPLSMRKWAMSSTRIAARISFRFFFNQPNFARGGDSLLTDHSCLEAFDLVCVQQRNHGLSVTLTLWSVEMASTRWKTPPEIKIWLEKFLFSSLTNQYDGSWRWINIYLFLVSQNCGHSISRHLKKMLHIKYGMIRIWMYLDLVMDKMQQNPVMVI